MTKLLKEDEIVVAVNNNDLFNNGLLHFQGVEQDQAIIDVIMKNIDINYIPVRRGSTSETTAPAYKNAELNFDFKQPIPYVIIKRGEEYYAYERLSKGGEQRLHNQLSIGWGGHQNPLKDSLSVPFSEVVMVNLERELEEELNIITKTKQLNFIGLINDDENEVGRVHLGILALLELSLDAEVSVREVEQLRGFWISAEELKEQQHNFESWSQFAIDIL